ncbi:hypothetical protein BsWGS_11115 [Bradybaena similaris]
MTAASIATESAIVSMATRRVRSFLVAGLLYLLHVTSARGDNPGVPDLAAYTGKAFMASFRSHPVYGNPAINVQLSSSASSTFNRLHSWFTFNTTSRSISGVPLPEDVGWTLLTIRAECDQVKSPEGKDAYFCKESSEEFKLTVHSVSWSDFLTPRTKNTEPSVQSSVLLPHTGDVSSVESTSGEHGCGEESVVASLVLCTSIDDLNTQDRFHLMVKLSDFLSIPISAIILEPSSSYNFKAMANGFQMVSAGPGSGDVCSLVQNVELLWELPCSTVKHLADFLRVLQHNVDGGRLADEINTGIVGWYVASSNPLLTKRNRRRRGAGQRSVVPTPVLMSLRPTSVVTADTSDIIISSVVTGDTSDVITLSIATGDTSVVITSSVLSPLTVDWSSSLSLASYKHDDSLDQTSSSTLSLLTSVITSSSVQSLISLSSAYESSRSVLQASPSVLDILSKVSITVMQEPISPTPQSAASTLHLLKASVSGPLVSDTLPELPGESTYLHSWIILSEPPLPVKTTVSHPEPTAVAASESLLEKILTTASQEEIVEGVRSVAGTLAVLSESDQLIPSDLLSSSKLPSLSLLFLDSDMLVTSRTVEILAFPFTSVETEPSISATPSSDVEISGSVEPSVGPEFTESAIDIESSVAAKSILEYSADLTSSHDVSDETSTSIAEDVFDYSTAFEHNATGQIPSRSSDIRATDQGTLLITHSRSELVAVTLAPTSDIAAVELNVTMTPSYDLSEEVTSTMDTLLVRDIDLGTGQILVASTAESELSHTAAIEDGYSSAVLYFYSADTSDQSTEPTLNTSSGYDTELSVSPAATVIMSGAVTAATAVSSLLSEPMASLTTIIAASFTSDTSEPVEAQQSASLSPGITEAVAVEETVTWMPSTPTGGSSPATPTEGSSPAAPTEESSPAAPTEESSPAAPTEESSPAAPTEESSPAAPTEGSSPAAPTEGSSAAAPTDAGAVEVNNKPYVRNPINRIPCQQGTLLRFMIPQDVFMDKEDGNTSSLTLSLMSASNQELPSNFWLYLESGDQILTGLPLRQDMAINNFSILLVATDKEGLSATDSITVQIIDAPRRDMLTHVFIMKFEIDFQKFMHNRRNLTALLNKIGAYFHDKDAHFITVLEVKRGSLVLSWTNNTLIGPECQMDAIKTLVGIMLRRDGIVKPSFCRQVGLDNNLTEVLFEPRGSCVPPTPTIETTTTYMVMDTSHAPGLSVWAHVILPVLIAVLVFVLIILIIIFCNRRRRQRQAVLNVEKEAVSNDRNPIFFPDELEVDDPSMKARDPLVLPTDPHPDNQSTPQDLSPSKISRDKERTSNQDSVEEEWVTKENTEAEQDHERNSDHRRRKGSKKQKEQGKDSGVSASSTLTWDRPNNHYLEEEAGSRSSTLNSTKSLGSKSLGSEKRHPKSPPPYWQSQSDPPPYRLPPPYLTETTSQV